MPGRKNVQPRPIIREEIEKMNRRLRGEMPVDPALFMTDEEAMEVFIPKGDHEARVRFATQIRIARGQAVLQQFLQSVLYEANFTDRWKGWA